MEFDLFQKAIFVSQNAVDFALQWLEDYWPQLPQGIHYYAVGEATARHLQHYGLSVSALTAANHGAMNSESLLQATELQQVTDEKIIIFRGCGGRGHLADVLRTRGARVTYCDLYERKIPLAAAEQLRGAFIDSSVWDVTQIIACHSGESLQHFLQVLSDLDDKALFERVRQLPILVPGERVAQLARDADFDSILVAENATDAAMTAALQQFNLTNRENAQ
jgi:uroporphyrinogen-III synthase